MREKGEVFLQRHREIGTRLTEARLRERRSVTECATVLKTTPRRYRAIERGDAAVNAVELEVLMCYLNMSGHEVWGSIFPLKGMHVEVHGQPGETVQLLVKIQSKIAPDVEGAG